MDGTEPDQEVAYAREIRLALGLNPVLQDESTIIRLAAALGRFGPVPGETEFIPLPDEPPPKVRYP